MLQGENDHVLVFSHRRELKTKRLKRRSKGSLLLHLFLQKKTGESPCLPSMIANCQPKSKLLPTSIRSGTAKSSHGFRRCSRRRRPSTVPLSVPELSGRPPTSYVERLPM